MPSTTLLVSVRNEFDFGISPKEAGTALRGLLILGSMKCTLAGATLFRFIGIDESVRTVCDLVRVLDET